MNASKWSPAAHGPAPFTREELDAYLAERLREMEGKMAKERRAGTLEMRMYYQGMHEAFGQCRLMVRAGSPFLP